jgi:hypothetical protein
VAAEAKAAGVPTVTLAQSAPFLLGNEKQGRIPLQRLKKLGVDVLLETRAQPVAEVLSADDGRTPGPGKYRLGDEERSFDMVFKCLGFKQVHSSFITPLGDVMLPDGSINVNPSFQVRCMAIQAVRQCRQSSMHRSHAIMPKGLHPKVMACVASQSEYQLLWVRLFATAQSLEQPSHPLSAAQLKERTFAVTAGRRACKCVLIWPCHQHHEEYCPRL